MWIFSDRVFLSTKDLSRQDFTILIVIFVVFYFIFSKSLWERKNEDKKEKERLKNIYFKVKKN